ncbi:hypothetical protein [Bacillus cereus group sp. BfR-BA-01380]|uniref:hypothetical protein n=1 Tax=Bacillus cereus group sp. BfR-BA-01380 TaxID=2920324 RepID=UPI001F5A740E|nr:hypothetical protein [Bacillus cereus group sp. BfR-BA-01380]
MWLGVNTNCTPYYKPLFLDWREELAMRRSGQCLFLPRAVLKQREGTSAGQLLFGVAVIYMLKNHYVMIVEIIKRSAK